MDLFTADDYAPIDHVRIKRVRDDDGEPTEWINLEGLQEGHVYSVRVRYGDLWHQMGVHRATRGRTR